MREIKFRVWNTLLKNYLPDDSVCILLNGDIVLYNLAAMITAYRRPSDMLEGENIVEQWTGLKDKNGVKIYEGDIIKYEDNVGKVFYNSEQACFNVSGFYDGLQDYPTMAFSECANIGMEVIGNIHEMNTEEIK